MSDEQPICTQNCPYVIKETPGKKAYCTCGISENQPYCDGKHKGTSFLPEVVEITESKNVAWCGCRKTANSPFCDGAHGKA